jgi:hypothetical protein
MPKTRFSTELIGEFSLTASKSSFLREGEVYFQLRDRYGRWIDMGKGVKFKIRLKNGKYHSVLGVNTGEAASDNTRGLIKVENDPYLPNGNYPVSSANLQQYIGLLTEEELAKGGIELGKDVDGNLVTAREDSAIPNIDDIIAEAEDVSSPTKELRTEITGDEIQDIKISSIAKALKAEGRFPAPRQSSLDTWGKTSDVTKGAKLDYAKVYEGMSSENPEFAEKYPTFNGFWDRVVDLAVDERTQSPNELDRINQEMKEINKGYAKHVMGLDPDNGTFTVYRNAINNAFEEKDAAVGYVSTSRNLAFDYNANTRVGEQANGRYEITVKPDEVNGMIGYSQVEDEYALTIGQGVTYQEGRVKKVGELETVKVAPWYEEAVGKLKRGQGATPFRGHSFVGQFDFLPISKNPMQGDKLQDFLDDNNITMDDWKNKFDELHGEGAYQRFKDSGRENQPSLQSLQKMFVDLGDGTYGLDVTQMSPAGNDTAGGSSFGDVQNTSSFVNDYVDNKLKFLSLIQEITGEPFMVHKSHSKSDPRLEDKVEIKQTKQTGIFQEYDSEQRTTEDSNAAEDTPLTDLGFDPEAEITVYRGVPEGVDEINAGDWVSSLPQLAKDYAGTGNVISMKVKAKDLLTDPSSGEGAYTEEMVYRPTTAKKPRTVSELPEIVNIEKTEVDDVKIEELYKPTDGEDFAAYEYQGSNYTVINKFSRVNPDYTFESRENFDPQTNSYIIDNIDKIDRAIDAYKITEEVEVYRGASVTKEKFDEMFANLDVGDFHIDSAYLSTSTDPSIGVKFAVRKLITDKDRIPVLFKAKLLPGQRALRVKELTQADALEENELLLPRNSKFKVTKVSKLTKGSSSGLNIELGSDDTDAFTDVKEMLVFEGEYVQDTDLEQPEPTPIVTDGTSTITDRKGNTINPGEEVDISYSIYEVGKGSSNAEKPLKAIFTGYKESDFSAGKGIETKNRAILYVPEQDGTVSGYYGVSSYVLNADPNSDDFRGVGGTSPVDIDGFSEKNALPNPKQMTSLSEQEAEEVIDYTRHKGSSEEINSSLRSNSVEPETQEKIEILDKIIGYNQILEDQDYYRGIPIPLGLTLKEFLNNLDSGFTTELEELGFSSTSTDEEMASIFANKYFGGGVVLRIKAKAGQSAYYVPKFLAGVIANENEVILPRGIKYRIVSHEFSPQDDKVVLDVEIGQPEPQAQDEKPQASTWDGVPFNPEFMEDNGETAYYMQEPNPPATTYHVAPKSAREDILKNGLDAKDQTWNTGVGMSGQEVFRDEHLWTKDDEGNDWAYEYRPTGVYMFDSLDRAREYANGTDGDIYEIDTVSNNRQIIRDPSGAINWEFLDEEDRAYVTRYVQPESLKLIDGDTPGVIDVVDEESTKARIEPGLDNWMPSLFDLLDSLEEDEDGEEITNDERGNILQSKFIEAAGFNGKPNLVTQEEFDAINSETLYRAVSDEKFIDNYINSETQFAGEGTSGNGTYTTNKRQTAEGFAGDTSNKEEVINKRLMEIKLAADANILYLERTSDWRAWIEKNKEILIEKAKEFGANPRNIQSIENKLTSTTDWSNYAIMLGYDGFKVSAGNNEYYTIILNRGKAIVNGKNLYFNPADGKWYKDSAFTIPLAQVDLN